MSHIGLSSRSAAAFGIFEGIQMPRLSETMRQLAALKSALPVQETAARRLADLEGFGSNPGNLRGRTFIPHGALASGAALVVVLHGCTQTAEGYDLGSGWSALAERHGFALLFPEQQRANNPNLCFNWFEPGDVRRGQGEALSIRQMIERMVADHPIDPTRIFITGLSAGGAMASVLLATYPELFAAGAIIAGLPYGCASSVAEAFECMRGQSRVENDELPRLVRAASRHEGDWPAIAVWQGTADHTVAPSNAKAILDQWLPLYGLSTAAAEEDVFDGHPRRVWRDQGGRVRAEEHILPGMGHGTPLDPDGTSGCGVGGPFMLDAGSCSTLRIAQSWHIVPLSETSVGERPPATAAPLPLHHSTALRSLRPGDVQSVIDDALRAAGLKR
jgi:poly(hydroxyalkanoate) depolymerase family esterase